MNRQTGGKSLDGHTGDKGHIGHTEVTGHSTDIGYAGNTCHAGRAGSSCSHAMAWLAAALLVFAVLYSAFLVAAETGHDCSGRDCPICAALAQCENTLRSVSGSSTAVLAAAPAIIAGPLCLMPVRTLVRSTPVTCKARMNN